MSILSLKVGLTVSKYQSIFCNDEVLLSLLVNPSTYTRFLILSDHTPRDLLQNSQCSLISQWAINCCFFSFKLGEIPVENWHFVFSEKSHLILNLTNIKSTSPVEVADTLSLTFPFIWLSLLGAA